MCSGGSGSAFAIGGADFASSGNPYARKVSGGGYSSVFGSHALSRTGYTSPGGVSSASDFHALNSGGRHSQQQQQQHEDTISQLSMDSTDSREPVFVAAAEIRRRLSESSRVPKSNFQR